MPMCKKCVFILTVGLAVGSNQAWATTYYVSPKGKDSNSGKTLSSPFKTIKKALAATWSGSNTIYVLTGTYAETLYIGQSNLTLAAYPGNAPIIDGNTTLPNSDWGALIGVDGNYNTISGFEVRNSNINGTYLGGYGVQLSGHHNALKNMNVHHTWQQGILANGDNSLVEDSKIWQCARANSINPGSIIWGTGISAARNAVTGITKNAIFRHNTVYNNWGEGMSCFEADNCLIEDNVVYDNWTVNLYLSDATNSLVRRNLVYISSNPAIPQRNNTKVGILLADEVASVPRSQNNTLVNNFIYNAGFGAFSWTGVYGSGLDGVLIANNTIVNGGFSVGANGDMNIINRNSYIANNVFLSSNNSVASSAGIVFTNNNWQTSAPLAAASSGDIIGDPLLQKTGTTTAGTLTGDYFKLQVGSPVIDRGGYLPEVTDDFFKQPREPLPDMGGHELPHS